MARKRSTLQQNRQGISVQADWSKGMVRDAPRTAVPVSALVYSTDFLLHQPGIMIKRGGWKYAGPALSGASTVNSVIYAPFPGGNKLLAVGSNNVLYSVTSGSTTSLGGSAVATSSVPVFRPGATSYVVFPDPSGASAPIAYSGTGSPAALGGSPPSAKYGCVYKTRLVLGGTTANPQRMYFSPTPDITSTWDTTNSWIDADYEITGFAATSNMLLIFSDGHTERIIGSTPPPGSDMDKSLIGSVGCTDARSIVVQENNVLFANPRGVYMTNGAGFACLTTEGMIETYWQSFFSSYDPSTSTIASGVYRSFYFVTVKNGSTLRTLMCDVPRRAWWEITNINTSMFSQAVGVNDELYFSSLATNRVCYLSSIFSPVSTNKNDEDGTAVEPTAQLRLVGSGPGLKHFGFGRMTIDMWDAASDNPTMTVEVLTGVEGVTTITVPESPLTETSDAERKRFTVGSVSQGVTLSLTQNGSSEKTEIYAVEVEERPLSQTAGGE